MTVDPVASAAAIPPAGHATGKFDGETTTVRSTGTGFACSSCSSSTAPSP